ncbi:PhzF family phenazine biosynthesis protein [Halalkalibacter flavus]|uniref:PhzF family phenazine biosynthesis protein n=1 Tax=Halalkalibacter flavus TaxID=3090668 RepID=UPI002FC62EDA
MGRKIEHDHVWTNIGHVPVEFVTMQGVLHAVIMEQVEPKVKKIETDLSELASYIGLTKDDIDTNYPVRRGYTGNWHLLIPVTTRKAIDQAVPQILKLKKHNERISVRLIYLHLIVKKKIA